jgi:hypothetical protein
VEARIDFAVTLPSNNGFSFLLLSGDSQNRRRLPHQGLDSVSNIVPDTLRPFDRVLGTQIITADSVLK